MIRVKASLLESVRMDPVAYARLLALGTDNKGGGSHGMFACMVDVARAVHLNKLNFREAIHELQSKFLRFRESPENKSRQEKLVEQLMAYLRLYKKMDLKWIDGTRRLQWSIVNEVMLTGLTPWVVADEKGYISYLIAEKAFRWDHQLRFPLYQLYLSENTIDCQPDEIRIGFYFADSNQFDLKSFKPRELEMAVDETGTLFSKLYSEYEKRKK